LVGALPYFEVKGAYGTVINALPYFGSHGGPIVAESEVEPVAVYRALAARFADLARATEVFAATLIESPFDPYRNEVESILKPAVKDSRIGQVTLLDGVATDEERVMKELIAPKARHSVRRAWRDVRSQSPAAV